MNMNAISKAPLMTILMRGFRRRCPRCGRGRLYRSYLKPVDACQSCAEQLRHIRADDIPAYFTMLLIMTLTLLSGIKGALMGLLWQLSLTGNERHKP